MFCLQTDILTFFLFLLLFWFCFFILAKLLKLEKRGWEVGPGYFLAKTTKLNRFINKLAQRFPRFWRVLWTIGIGFGFIAMIFIMAFLGYNFYALLTAPKPENALVPFIPGVTVTGLPLLYMIIPIAIIMLCHEIAHGIASRIDGVTVKSSGFLAFLLLFGAFVELDDEQAAKKSRRTRQRIFAAGSFSNFIVAIFALILVINMYKIGTGAYLYHVYDEGPSFGQLNAQEIILKVNGTSIKNQWDLSSVLDQFKPFDPVLFTVEATNGSIYNRTVIAGFNRSATYTPWGALLLNDGINLSGTLNSLSLNDQNPLTLQSSATYLNFSLIINISTYNIPPENLSALFVDMEIHANESNFNDSKVYLTNFQNPTLNYEIFSLQNLQSGINITGNITKAAGYDLKEYFNTSKCLVLNFIFNRSSDFTVDIDVCKLYMITNQSTSYYGIVTTYNVEDRELAIILGPLAPHIYKILSYLYMFSLAIALINLLPIPPFDGDKLFVTLFETSKTGKKEQESDSEINDSSKEKPPKPKEPWTWKKTVIWSVRGLAIFFFLGNIILSILLFNIFTLFSSFL